jgi:pimeloyl-ACP methyl ester carboxylesterase
MMNSYDRVEWNYLEAIMLKLGFSQWWVTVGMGMHGQISLLLSSSKWEKVRGI